MKNRSQILRVLSLLLCSVLLISCFSGCQKKNAVFLPSDFPLVFDLVHEGIRLTDALGQGAVFLCRKADGADGKIQPEGHAGGAVVILGGRLDPVLQIRRVAAGDDHGSLALDG